MMIYRTAIGIGIHLWDRALFCIRKDYGGRSMTNDIRRQGALRVFSQIKGFVKKKEIILTDCR
jgi:hypothetical protein